MPVPRAAGPYYYACLSLCTCRHLVWCCAGELLSSMPQECIRPGRRGVPGCVPLQCILWALSIARHLCVMDRPQPGPQGRQSRRLHPWLGCCVPSPARSAPGPLGLQATGGVIKGRACLPALCACLCTCAVYVVLSPPVVLVLLLSLRLLLFWKALPFLATPHFL